jgi:hypothetical protein
MPMTSREHDVDTQVRSLLDGLRSQIAQLAAAEAAFSPYCDNADPWQPDDPKPFCAPEECGDDQERAQLKSLETEWQATWRIIEALDALGYPAHFDESDCDPYEATGLAFVATFERSIRFGDITFASWKVWIQGEAQQGSSGFFTYSKEEDHDIPDILLQRLGFERTDSDFPWNYDDACELFGFNDDEEEDEEDEDEDEEDERVDDIADGETGGSAAAKGNKGVRN